MWLISSLVDDPTNYDNDDNEDNMVNTLPQH